MYKKEIVVGKHTLESLTTGMYLEPRALFREYIQNSVDSIDCAINEGIVRSGHGRIDIRISQEDRSIVIEDNGEGVKVSDYGVIVDIGNSKKHYSSSRGFRGIGRLSAISYCDSLTFITTSKGEAKRLFLTINCEKLRNSMLPGNGTGGDLSSVLSDAMSMRIQQEAPSKHYFKVILDGVSHEAGLLDYGQIKDYIIQVSPIPFLKSQFSYSNRIRNFLANYHNCYQEYDITLHNGLNHEKMFKPYTDIFVADKFKKVTDRVSAIEIREILNVKGDVIAILWYSVTNYVGALLDSSKKGLRYRKGNILVGDRKSLNYMFKEERFSSWFQGEVYVIDPQIVPNARRDDFEYNKNYTYLREKLVSIGDELSRKLRQASAARNLRAKETRNAEDMQFDDDEMFVDVLTNETSVINREEAEKIADKHMMKKQKALYTLETIIGSITEDTTSSYRFANVFIKCSDEQKKVLEKVLIILSQNLNKKEYGRVFTLVRKALC